MLKRKTIFFKKKALFYFKNGFILNYYFSPGEKGMKNDDVMLLWASHGRSQAVCGRGERKNASMIYYTEIALSWAGKKCSKMYFFELGV